VRRRHWPRSSRRRLAEAERFAGGASYPPLRSCPRRRGNARRGSSWACRSCAPRQRLKSRRPCAGRAKPIVSRSRRRRRPDRDWLRAKRDQSLDEQNLLSAHRTASRSRIQPTAARRSAAT
jgi:hypothetical protein